MDMSLDEYARVICAICDIPVLWASLLPSLTRLLYSLTPPPPLVVRVRVWLPVFADAGLLQHGAIPTCPLHTVL